MVGHRASLVPCTEGLVVERDDQIDHKKLLEPLELGRSMDEELLGVDRRLEVDSSKDRTAATATDHGLE